MLLIPGPTHPFSTSTVVLHVQDQRILKGTLAFELLDDPADPLIHPIDHRGVDFHARRFPSFVLDTIPIPDPFGQDHALCIEPQFDSLFESSLSNRFVTGIITASIARDILGERMHRPMSSGVGDVQKKRFLRVLLRMLA